MRWLPLILAAATIGAPGAARASESWFDRGTLQGTLNLGVADSDDISSWTAGGFGKSRFSRGPSGVASLEGVWRPELTNDVSLIVDGISQPRFGRPVDIAEAYVLYKPVPTSTLHVQGRAGLLYVPVSLEHDSVAGEPWSVRDTITPSAINTWIGEEVKVLGVEARVQQAFGVLEAAATAGVFSHNDTAGALLALRGWAFSDLVATAGARVPLPPLSDYVSWSQATHTDPVDSVDGRLGAYGKIELAGPRGSVDLAAYDNNAALGAGHDGQWAWRTSFYNLGAVVPLTSSLTLSSQVMDGRTQSQLGSAGSYRFDVGFEAAYLRLVKELGGEVFTLRADVFETSSPHPSPGDLHYHPGPLDPDETYSESGWSGLAAWKHRLASDQSLLVEVLDVDWKRPYAAAFGVEARQNLTTLQVAYRKAF